MNAASAPPFDALATPGLVRRLAAFVYEGLLLFGVVFAAALAYALVTQQRHALEGRMGLIACLFAVLAVYFVWFWSRTGQTLAMQTWHIRLVTQAGKSVTRSRAFARYLCAYVWFAPAFVTWSVTDPAHNRVVIWFSLVAGILAYAALALLHPQRQFWHDALCGTRLVTWRPTSRRAQSAG